MSAVAGVLVTGGLGIAAPAAAQDAAYVYAAQAVFQGTVPGHDLTLACETLDSSSATLPCSPQGTFSIQVTAAAKRKLGISSATVEQGHLVPCGGGVSCGSHFTIPSAVKRKLNADIAKSNRPCSCEHGILVSGMVTITLTGPTGLPNETISDSGKLSIGGSIYDRTQWEYACTSDWSQIQLDPPGTPPPSCRPSKPNQFVVSPTRQGRSRTGRSGHRLKRRPFTHLLCSNPAGR